MPFSVETTWESSFGGFPEELATSARIRLVSGDRILTRCISEFSETEEEEIHVSALPLAKWFAANFWRILHEPARFRQRGWMEAHRLASAGEGYIWPDVTLWGDGYGVSISIRPSRRRPGIPVGFLEGGRFWLPRAAVEKTLIQFMVLVSSRLWAKGFTEAEYHEIIGCIQQDAADPEVREWREFEALLGFDPGYAPDQLMTSLGDGLGEYGPGSTRELAGASGASFTGVIADIRGILKGRRAGRIDSRVLQSIEEFDSMDRAVPAWVNAERAAKRFRQAIGLNGDPVPNSALEQALGLPSRLLRKRITPSEKGGMTVGILRRDAEHVAIALKSTMLSSRRFNLTRLLGDLYVRDKEDTLLPVTDSRMYRQQFQRAFAQEVLCPFESLRGFLGDSEEIPDDDIDAVAEHYGVSSWLVRSELMNNNVISRDEYYRSREGGWESPFGIGFPDIELP